MRLASFFLATYLSLMPTAVHSAPITGGDSEKASPGEKRIAAIMLEGNKGYSGQVPLEHVLVEKHVQGKDIKTSLVAKPYDYNDLADVYCSSPAKLERFTLQNCFHPRNGNLPTLLTIIFAGAKPSDSKKNFEANLDNYAISMVYYDVNADGLGEGDRARAFLNSDTSLVPRVEFSLGLVDGKVVRTWVSSACEGYIGRGERSADFQFNGFKGFPARLALTIVGFKGKYNKLIGSAKNDDEVIDSVNSVEGLAREQLYSQLTPYQVAAYYKTCGSVSSSSNQR